MQDTTLVVQDTLRPTVKAVYRPAPPPPEPPDWLNPLRRAGDTDPGKPLPQDGLYPAFYCLKPGNKPVFLNDTFQLPLQSHSEIPYVDLRAGKQRDTLIQDWTVGVVLALLLLISALFTLFRKQIRPLFLSAISYQLSQSLFRERSGGKDSRLHLFSLLFFISGSFFLYTFLSRKEIYLWGLQGFNYWLALAALLPMVYLLKYILNFLAGLLSPDTSLFREYLFSVFQFNRLLGIFLSIPLILMPYLQIIPLVVYLYCGLVCTALILILRLIRLLAIFSSRGVSIVYVILYLCALEIVPFWVLIKILSSTV